MSFRNDLASIPSGVTFRSSLRGKPGVVVLFVTRRARLTRRFPAVTRAIYPNGSIWMAWPKRASKVPIDITEDVVREVVLPVGLVDNKACAFDAIGSGLRVVWRRENRGGLTSPDLGV